MICKHCGTEINTKIREADGSVVCPGCGTVYRPKSAPKPEQRPTAAPAAEPRPARTDDTHRSSSQPRKAAKRSGAGVKAAIAIFAAVLIIGGVVALVTHGKNNKDNNGQTSSNPTYISESNQVAVAAQPVSYEHQILGLVYTEQAKPREEFMVDLCQQLGMNFYDYESYQMNFVMDNPAGIYDAACELIDAGCTTIIIYDKSDTTYPFDTADLLAQTRPDIKVVLTRNPNYVPNAGGIAVETGTNPAPASGKSLEIAYTETFNLGSDGLVSSHAFQNGVAWAILKNQSDNTSRLGLINKYGEVIFLLDENRFSEKLSNLIYTPFINGLAAVYPYDSVYNVHPSFAGFIIINQNGEIVFDSKDENLYMSGQADDGTFFLVKHESGFSADVWKIYTLDSSLELHETNIDCSEDARNGQNTFPHYTKLADGLYYKNNGNGYYLNLTKEVWFPVEHTQLYNGTNLISYGFVNNYAAFYLDISGTFAKPRNGYSTFQHICLLPINVLSGLSTSDQIIDELMTNDACIVLRKAGEDVGHDIYSFSTSYGGSFYHQAPYGKYPVDYVDFDGNPIMSFPSFPDGVSYEYVGEYSDGFLPIYLKGADGKIYATIINEAGSVQYDPVGPLNLSRGDKDTIHYKGYIFFVDSTDKSLRVITPQGEIKRLGDTLPGLENDHYSQRIETSLSIPATSVALGDGYLFTRFDNWSYKYYSINGSSDIEKVIASYNGNGELVYTGTDGIARTSTTVRQPTATQETTQATAPQKAYITPSSFSIEGKWKNTGTYTYGQVQSGAIVSFDGTTCNVVSPADTYAFYKDGNDYRLDCTTMLFSETQSFVVKIVDQDHIDIYVGNNYLELARVS